MVKTRILLVVISAVLIVLLFMLPKVVVDNDAPLKVSADSTGQHTSDPHAGANAETSQRITLLRSLYNTNKSTEKSAIFADSLAGLYRGAGRFDSAAWFMDKAAAFFNTPEYWVQAGDDYYQAYTFAMDEQKQAEMAAQAQAYFGKVLEKNPRNLEVKARLAMTYLSSANPMQGITLLREVLAEDPNNETALFNLGMLSIQSGQYDKAVDRLKELVSINPAHVQGQLLLGVAYMNTGNKKQAKEQFEKVKKMESDPAVQATVDSYLNDLN
jgi:tetratricopeptide (TPR) repeat protein